MEQRTPDWFATRAGRFTGSRFADLMGSATVRDGLIRDLAWERFRGQCVETYQNDAMRRGTELEPMARDWYAFTRDVEVREIAFIVHPVHDFIGVSPDGLIDPNGMVEIKCPGHRAHMDTLASRKVPGKYKWQVQGQLMVAQRAWLDFVSYHPEQGGVIVRVLPDAKAQKELETACLKANAEVNEWVSILADKEAA